MTPAGRGSATIGSRRRSMLGSHRRARRQGGKPARGALSNGHTTPPALPSQSQRILQQAAARALIVQLSYASGCLERLAAIRATVGDLDPTATSGPLSPQEALLVQAKFDLSLGCNLVTLAERVLREAGGDPADRDLVPAAAQEQRAALAPWYASATATLASAAGLSTTQPHDHADGDSDALPH
jgi:hypothetical protein